VGISLEAPKNRFGSRKDKKKYPRKIGNLTGHYIDDHVLKKKSTTKTEDATITKMQPIY
jgi:hypothetical protein